MHRDLAQAYNELKSRGRAERPKPGSLPASQVLGCRRRLALRVLGEAAPYRPGAAHLSEGQMHEIEIIQRLRALGYRITMTGEREGWFTSQIAGIRIRGQVDGILPHLDAVLEVKTVGQEVKLRAMDKPYLSWQVQTEVYMRAFEQRRTLLFAKARDTGWARQWRWKRSDRIWEAIQRNVAAVATVADPWELDVAYGRECAWCPWSARCWGASPEQVIVEF